MAIATEQRGAVRILAIDRAERRNAIDTATAAELERAVRDAGDDPDTHALVLTGIGEHFSAGGDVADILEKVASGDDRDLLALLRTFHRLVVEIWESRLPVVAAVSGVAYGGGFNLALACDLVVLSADARLCQVFVRRGVVPDVGGAWLLPRLVGMQRAKELMLLAPEIDARRVARPWPGQRRRTRSPEATLALGARQGRAAGRAAVLHRGAGQEADQPQRGRRPARVAGAGGGDPVGGAAVGPGRGRLRVVPSPSGARRSEHRHSRRDREDIMNIANLLRRSASDHPDQVALRLDDTEITYAGYAEHGGRFAAFLRAAGVEPGERVGFFLPNCLEYLQGMLGVWQAGAVAVPLNYMFPDAALRHAVVDSGARYLVVLPADVARLTDVLGDALPELLTLGPDGTYEAALAAHGPATDVTPRVDGDDALLMYTSGSTGVPKGVRQTHRNTTAHCDAVIDLYEIDGSDHVLNCMPLFHVGGLQLASLTVLLRAGQITFMPRWDPMRWLQLAQDLRPTYGGLISTMMIDVGNRTVGSPVVLDSFRICMFGGSRSPSAAIERLEAGTGIKGTEIYGQTEQSGLVISYAPGDPRRPNSMGRPLEQIVHTRLISPETGEDVPPGSDAVGELWVRVTP